MSVKIGGVLIEQWISRGWIERGQIADEFSIS